MIQLNIHSGSSVLGHFGGHGTSMNGYHVNEFNTGTPRGPDDIGNSSGYASIHQQTPPEISQMPKHALITILHFIPHSKLLEYKRISKYFNKLIQNGLSVPIYFVFRSLFSFFSHFFLICFYFLK